MIFGKQVPGGLWLPVVGQVAMLSLVTTELEFPTSAADNVYVALDCVAADMALSGSTAGWTLGDEAELTWSGADTTCLIAATATLGTNVVNAYSGFAYAKNADVIGQAQVSAPALAAGEMLFRNAVAAFVDANFTVLRRVTLTNGDKVKPAGSLDFPAAGNVLEMANMVVALFMGA